MTVVSISVSGARLPDRVGRAPQLNPSVNPRGRYSTEFQYNGNSSALLMARCGEA